MSVANNFANDSVTAMALDSSLVRKRVLRQAPLFGAYAALLVFMFIYCARPEDWIPVISRVPLAKIAASLALLALGVSLQHFRARLPQEVYLLILLTAQLFAASVMSPVWRGGALKITLNFAKGVLVVLLIAATVSTLHRLRLLILTQAVSISAIAAVTIWKDHLIVGRLEGVLGGQYVDPNDLALAMIISLPLCLALLFLSKNRLWKIVWVISILMMLYAVFLTESRGGFLALIVMAVVILWEFAIRGRRRYLLTLTAVVGLVLFLFAGGRLVERLKGTFNVKDATSEAYESAQSRRQLFWRSIEVTIEHPLFGVGPGNFNQVSGQWHTTHNSLTLMSSEGGIPAFILYVLILWRGFKNLRATKRLPRGIKESSLLARALLASLAGYTVGSLFLSVAYEFFPFILVAYTTALFAISRKIAAQSRKSESAQQPAENKLFVDAASVMSFHTT